MDWQAAKPFYKYLGVIVGIAIFAGAWWVIYEELSQLNFNDILLELSNKGTVTLVLAFLAVLASLFCLSIIDYISFKPIIPSLSYGRILLASLAGYGISYSLGFSAVTGSAARYKALSNCNIDGATLAHGLARVFAFFWIGCFFVLGTVFIAEGSILAEYIGGNSLLYKIGGSAILISLLVFLFLLAKRKREITVGTIKMPMPTFQESGLAILLCTADWLFASAALYLLLPPETGLTFFHFTGFFVVAQLAGLISHVPGGLGIFEALILVSLGNHTEHTAATVSALVIFRLMYYVFPLFVAVVILTYEDLVKLLKLFIRSSRASTRIVSSIFPKVISIVVLLSGVILLTSGATPAAQGRMELVRSLIPLPIIELTHFAGSIIGVCLIALSRGLWFRLKEAYFATLLLLTAGIAASLLKGFDYEEATILFVITGMLLVSSKNFYRVGRVTQVIPSSLMIGVLFGVLILTTWVVFFAYKDIPYANQLWWEFELSSDVSRSIRAMAGVIFTVLFFTSFAIFSLRRAHQGIPATEHLPELVPIIKKSKSAYSWLALLGDKQILFSKSKKSFLMYSQSGKSLIALGEPVGDANEHRELIWEFREKADLMGFNPVFYQVEAKNLSHYIDVGLTLSKLGEEALIKLDTFSLEGGRHSNQRHTLRRIERERFIFRVLTTEEVHSRITELKAVSDAWLIHKKSKEKSFSLGRFSEEYISHMQIAVVEKISDATADTHEIVAFANLWLPEPKNEFSIDLMRYKENAPKGVMEYLFLQLLTWGKTEGYKAMNLGMAPLSGLERHPLAPLWHKLGSFIFRHGEHFYNFQGLRAYKEKFDPVWQPKYLASPGGFSIPVAMKDIAKLVSGGYRGIFLK